MPASPPWYPLKFHPVLLEKPWGGRKLGRLLGKALPDGKRIGESWELSDYPGHVVRVANGAFADMPLDVLLSQHAEALLGPGAAPKLPLLVKFLDAAETLSVQVHPPRRYLEAHGISEPPKREAWYILQADSDAKVYVGLKEGVDAERLRRAVADEGILDLLTPYRVKVGDVILVPPGAVHTLGPGVLVLEVQRPSDLTLRLFDWQRQVGGAAQRPLHVEEALEAIEHGVETARRTSSPIAGANGGSSRHLVLDDSAFRWELFRYEGLVFEAHREARFRVIIVLEGGGDVIWNEGADKLDYRLGECLLIPACLGDFQFNADQASTLLQITVP